jgi:hypothetical protein
MPSPGRIPSDVGSGLDSPQHGGGLPPQERSDSDDERCRACQLPLGPVAGSCNRRDGPQRSVLEPFDLLADGVHEVDAHRAAKRVFAKTQGRRTRDAAMTENNVGGEVAELRSPHQPRAEVGSGRRRRDHQSDARLRSTRSVRLVGLRYQAAHVATRRGQGDAELAVERRQPAMSGQPFRCDRQDARLRPLGRGRGRLKGWSRRADIGDDHRRAGELVRPDGDVDVSQRGGIGQSPSHRLRSSDAHDALHGVVRCVDPAVDADDQQAAAAIGQGAERLREQPHRRRLHERLELERLVLRLRDDREQLGGTEAASVASGIGRLHVSIIPTSASGACNRRTSGRRYTKFSPPSRRSGSPASVQSGTA